MSETAYLKRAILLSTASKEPVGCGCLIVLNDRVLAEAVNSQRRDRQAINHAEIKALQLANQAANSRTLEGAVVYSSCEPCVMCLAALSLAKVKRIVYAKKMSELFPEDPMARVDSSKLIEKFNHIPELKHLVI